MAWGRLPLPGTPLGPCVPTCTHRDCAWTRAQATGPCGRCDQPIGYDVRYYDVRTDKQRQAISPLGYVHADCEEDAIEAEREQVHETA